LGFGGRRVLVSRKWSGRPLAVHRAERREWVRGLLGLADDPDPKRYIWIQASPNDPDVKSKEERLMLSVADRSRWREELRKAQEAANCTTAPFSTAPTTTAA
jgi:hypothetical protein